jgi:hypothetical protein
MVNSDRETPFDLEIDMVGRGTDLAAQPTLQSPPSSPAPPKKATIRTIGEMIRGGIAMATAMANLGAAFGAILGVALGVIGGVIRGTIPNAIIVASFGVVVLVIAGSLYGAILGGIFGGLLGAVAGVINTRKTHNSSADRL